jgi:predicted aspartyl protease
MFPRLAVAAAFALLLFIRQTPACSDTNELLAGIQAYNNAQYTQAIDHLSRAQATQKLVPRALYYRALSEFKLGRNGAATDTLRTLVALSPNAPEATLAKRYLTLVDNPSTTPDTAPLPKHIRIPYRQTKEGWLHVDATVNGQSLDMVWDTGATNCSVPLEAIGGVPRNAKNISVETPAGPQQAWIAPVKIEAGELKRSALTTVMSGTAVIGQSFFQDYKVEFNKEQHKIYLDYVGTAGSGTATAGAAPRPTSKFQLPFEREAGILLVDIKLNGTVMKAYFDTGCAAKGIAMTKAMTREGFVDVSIGPISRQHVPVTVAESLTRPLVGPAIFGDRNFKIDPARQVIDFDYVQ